MGLSPNSALLASSRNMLAAANHNPTREPRNDMEMEAALAYAF
jgi:hypothetical protein